MSLRSGITAAEKFKHQMNGNTHRYVYCKCTRTKDSNCSCGFINEDDPITQLQDLMNDLDIQIVPMREQIASDFRKFKKFE